MLVDFEKWHGCRNDFMLIKLSLDNTLIHSLQKAAPKLCSRDGSGVGADGIIAIAFAPSNDSLDPDAVFIINSDGSLAGNCGNGLRCAAMSLYQESLRLNPEHPQSHFEFPIFSSLASGALTADSEAAHRVSAEIISPAEGNVPLAALAMGRPAVNEAWPQYEEAKATLSEVAKQQDLPWLLADFGAGDIGNPHVVVFTELEHLSHSIAVGTAMQSFAGGINAHLVSERPATDIELREGHRFLAAAIDMTYEMKIFERGAGETPACGSGACMVAAIALADDLADRSQWLRVVMPGGAVYLQQESPDDPVRMAGPAEVVYRGVFSL